MLEAAAARFVEPELFFAEDRVPVDFVPPRADDFFDAVERVPDFEADFEPPRVEDFDAPFEDDFPDVREEPLEPDFEVDFEALFFAPPLFADDLDALFFAPPEDDRAAVFLEDEAPPFAEDFVPFFAPEDEPLEPLLFAGVEVPEPPDEPAELD